MAYTERLSEQLAIVSTVDPDAYTVGATTTTTFAGDTIDMSTSHRVMFIIMTGILPAQSVIDFNVYSATGSTTGTNTTTALVSITALGNADDDEQVVVEVEGQDLADGYRYLVPHLTVGNTGGGTLTCDLAMVALADTERYKPASANHPDLASVSEIVNA